MILSRCHEFKSKFVLIKIEHKYMREIVNAEYL